MNDKKRRIAEKRGEDLKSRIQDYLDARPSIPSGLDMTEEFNKSKKLILQQMNGNNDDWEDWRWQIRNRIQDTEILSKLIDLSDEEISAIKEVEETYRWAVSPYYASLMSKTDPKCPIRQQAVPVAQELYSPGKQDPMAEEYTSPAPRITRRYPDRLIINVTNQCAMYCRHCQRRRNIGETDDHAPECDLKEAISYIKEHEEIRDVLITGGDALMLEDETLDWLLTELDNIEHVEMKRLGTRTLVTMPQRITPELCNMLEKHHPLYINTQFNHGKEVTESAKKATSMLSKAGIPLGNQAVLLKGINDDPNVMKKMNHDMLKIRVRPYYIFQAKYVKGTTHFVCRVEEGLDIMENLRGYTSGMAIPTYIINAPEGQGKTPVFPQYVVNWSKDKVVIRTWERKIVDYPNKSSDVDD